MISGREISDILQILYAAPTKPELWHDFLQQFSRTLSLTGAAILHQDLERGQYNAEYAFGVAAEGAPMYQRYYGTIDEWRPAFLKKAEGDFALGDDLCPLDRLKTTEFFNDFLLKHDLRLYGAVATVKRPKQVELVTMYQSWKGESPGKETEELVGMMVPHIRRALQLRRSFIDIKAHSDSLELALDLVQAGILFLDSQGRVLSMNRSAEELSTRGALKFRAGRLYPSLPSEIAKLEALVRAAISRPKEKPAVGGSMLISRIGSRPLTLVVAPLNEISGRVAQKASAVAFIYDPEQKAQLPQDLLIQTYGLTTAESRLALLLVEGHSLRDAAEMRGVAFNTVRSQVKSIFSKTGTRRQGELVGILMGSSASVRI